MVGTSGVGLPVVLGMRFTGQHVLLRGGGRGVVGHAMGWMYGRKERGWVIEGHGKRGFGMFLGGGHIVDTLDGRGGLWLWLYSVVFAELCL